MLAGANPCRAYQLLHELRLWPLIFPFLPPAALSRFVLGLYRFFQYIYIYIIRPFLD